MNLVPLIKTEVFNYNSIDELLKLASEQVYDKGTPCEGVVIRPVEEDYSSVMNSRLSIKVINNEFLMKCGE